MGLRMISDLPVLSHASQMARHAAMRQRIVAENLANADTPGYRARDIPDFSVGPGEGFTPRQTREGHGGPSQPVAWHPREVDMPASPNGNTVVLEDQLLSATSAEGQHRLAMTVYSKAVELLRAGLGRVR